MEDVFENIRNVSSIPYTEGSFTARAQGQKQNPIPPDDVWNFTINPIMIWRIYYVKSSLIYVHDIYNIWEADRANYRQIVATVVAPWYGDGDGTVISVTYPIMCDWSYEVIAIKINRNYCTLMH